MDVAWAHAGEELSVRDVADELDGYAYTTIGTVLDRLARKGQLRRRRDGHVLTFGATGTDASHTADAMRESLDASDDPVGALRQLGSLLSAEEMAALRAALRGRPSS